MKKLIAVIVVSSVLFLLYTVVWPNSINEPESVQEQAKNTEWPENVEAVAAVSAPEEESYEVAYPEELLENTDTEAADEAVDYSQISLSAWLQDDEDDEHVVLHTGPMYTVALNDLRAMIANLAVDDPKDQRAYVAEYELEQEMGNMSSIMLDTVQCSNEICAVIFSSYDADLRDTTLESTFRNDAVKDISRGGLLRSFERDGLHLGVAVIVLDNGKPLKLVHNR